MVHLSIGALMFSLYRPTCNLSMFQSLLTPDWPGRGNLDLVFVLCDRVLFLHLLIAKMMIIIPCERRRSADSFFVEKIQYINMFHAWKCLDVTRYLQTLTVPWIEWQRKYTWFRTDSTPQVPAQNVGVHYRRFGGHAASMRKERFHQQNTIRCTSAAVL